MSTKIDLFKERKAEYVARKKPAWVEITSAPYLAVDGTGAPGAPSGRAAASEDHPTVPGEAIRITRA